MSDIQIGEMQSNTDRLNNFSDGVVAVIITLMVLELKAPSVSSFAALVPLLSLIHISEPTRPY